MCLANVVHTLLNTNRNILLVAKHFCTNFTIVLLLDWVLVLYHVGLYSESCPQDFGCYLERTAWCDVF